MGTLEVDHVVYPIDSRTLACLPGALTALFQAHRFVDLLLTFSNTTLRVRLHENSELAIQVEHDVRADEDGAGLLTSEYLMMGRIHLVGVGSAPPARPAQP